MSSDPHAVTMPDAPRTPVPGEMGPGVTVMFDGPRPLELTVEYEVPGTERRRVFEARGGSGERFLLLLGGEATVAATRVVDPRVLRPVAVRETPLGYLHAYAHPGAPSVRAWLAESTTGPDAMDVLRFGVSLCEVLESIHGTGRCVMSLDPDAVLRAADGTALLVGFENAPTPGALPGLVWTSTAAPEVLHRLAPLCGLSSDVYSVAALLHALLARHELWRPPGGMSTVLAHQFSPRTWRAELPLGIWPRLAPALDPDPARRTPHLAALRHALEGALSAAQRRRNHVPAPQVLDGWADSHIGIGKARRGGDQQDRLFCGLGVNGTLALGAVADGVSHASLGDGGTAAEHTVQAVRRLFEQVGNGISAGLDPAGLDARAHMLTDVMHAATAAISADANANYPRLQGDTAGVMASTLVMVLVDRGVATLLNVGDSRAYLFDGEVCEALTIDHDRRTEAVRGGMDPYQAHVLEAGGALTRAVGRSIRASDGSLVPSPSPVDIFHMPLMPGDRLVLCSDGLPDYCMPQTRGVQSPVAVELALNQVVRPLPDASTVSHALIGLANQHGGHDNIAVVVLHVGGS